MILKTKRNSLVLFGVEVTGDKPKTLVASFGSISPNQPHKVKLFTENDVEFGTFRIPDNLAKQMLKRKAINILLTEILD